MTWQSEWWLVALTVAGLAAIVVATAKDWGRASRAGGVTGAVRVLVAAGLVVIALRPSGEQEVETPVAVAADVVVMLDRTASMGALDHRGGRSRMEGAGEDLAALVADAAGAHVTVITFDDTARVLVPATTDVNSVVTTLRTVGWRPSAKATGSDVSVGVDLAREVLVRAAELRPGNRRMIVYAGDGEQTQAAARASFAPLADLVHEAWVLGYGTSAGGVMPIAPDDSALVTRDGVQQRSVIDEDALRGIAEELSGTYAHRSGADGLPDTTVQAAGPERELVPGAEHYWIVALALVPFLLAHLVVAVRRWREIKEAS
ncbi:VWA domain-containing protein [Nocardioides sp. zg-536]|uniref:VWA domain-containing protein n=1 Tax=Nocardioides faecalis TaxID=2803858 RepID=A0A938YBV7_9ACTN|nr:VWA domain-containing protein [Nocardioides faecalis]MBM9461783.1 VWA domain-containing protein [Nocardioides faecalis]QVI57815.1 VWA domain-containing protein [Nocardioides faecalis]